MAGLLDAIVGSNDPSTADPNTGLVEAQRRQLLVNTLGQTGALLLAAGEPQSGAQRGQTLAQLGNVPASTQAQASEMSQQNYNAQRILAVKRQNEQQSQLAAYMQSPEFQKLFASLPPAQQAVVAASAKSGDINATLKALQEGIQMNQWKATPDGSFINVGTGMVFDPTRGQTYNLGQMAQQAQAGGGGGPSQAPGNDVVGEDYLKTLPTDYANTLRAYQDGRLGISPMMARTPRGMKIIEDLNRAEPGFDQTNYQERQKFRTSVTSGPLFKDVVLPANKMLNHANEYLDKYDALGMDGGPVSYVTNNLKWAKAKSNRTGTFMAAEENLNTFKKEFEKVMAGKGQLTDEARRTMTGLTPTNSPEETYRTIGTMISMMNGQVHPVEVQKEQTMGKAMPNPLIQPQGLAVMQRVAKGPPGAQTATPQQQGPPPPPPGVDPGLWEQAIRRGIVK